MQKMMSHRKLTQWFPVSQPSSRARCFNLVAAFAIVSIVSSWSVQAVAQKWPERFVLSPAETAPIAAHLADCSNHYVGQLNVGTDYQVRIKMFTDGLGAVTLAMPIPADLERASIDPGFQDFAQREMRLLSGSLCGALPLPADMLGQQQTLDVTLTLIDASHTRAELPSSSQGLRLRSWPNSSDSGEATDALLRSGQTEPITQEDRSEIESKAATCLPYGPGAKSDSSFSLRLRVLTNGSGIVTWAGLSPNDVEHMRSDGDFREFAQNALNAVLSPTCSKLPLPYTWAPQAHLFNLNFPPPAASAGHLARGIFLGMAPTDQNRSVMTRYAEARRKLGEEWWSAFSAFVDAHKYFPMAASTKGEDGQTVMHLVIERDGSVRSATVELSSGSPRLDTAWLSEFRGAKVPALPPGTADDEISFSASMTYILERE